MSWAYWLIILIVVVAVIIVTFISFMNIKSWYFTDAVNRPPQAPPGALFGIIWTILYILYAYVWCLAYSKSKDCNCNKSKYINTTGINVLFAISLLLNVMWVVVFFGIHNLVLSQIIIVFLLITILIQAYVLWMLGSGLGIFLLLIYAAWVLTATFLNFSTTFNRR